MICKHHKQAARFIRHAVLAIGYDEVKLRRLTWFARWRFKRQLYKAILQDVIAFDKTGIMAYTGYDFFKECQS